jgi:hypothetical protein
MFNQCNIIFVAHVYVKPDIKIVIITECGHMQLAQCTSVICHIVLNGFMCSFNYFSGYKCIYFLRA